MSFLTKLEGIFAKTPAPQPKVEPMVPDAVVPQPVQTTVAEPVASAVVHPTTQSIERAIVNFTFQTIEQHLEAYGKTVESEVLTKAQQFVAWATNEEAKFEAAVKLLKDKGLTVIKNGVTL